MTELQVRILIAGVCFGLWPLVMNKSGLSGNMSSLVLTAIVFIVVGFASFAEPVTVSNANWPVVVTASVISGVGLLAFSGGLAITTPQQVSSFFILVMLIQIATPAIYHVIQNGFTFYKLVGFVLAGAAAYFLNK